MKEIKTKQELLDTLNNSSKPVFVKIGAPWCAPCGQIQRTLLDIEGGYANDYEFFEVDSEEAEDSLIGFLAVYNLPTIVIFKGQDIIFRHSGLLTRPQLTQILDEYKG